MKNAAAKARNAKTRVRKFKAHTPLKPRKLKAGEMLSQGRLPKSSDVIVGDRVYPLGLHGDRRLVSYRRRLPVLIDFPIFVVADTFRLAGKAMKLLGNVFLLDLAVYAGKRLNERRRVRRAVKAHDRIKASRLKPLEDLSAQHDAPLARRGRPVGSRDKSPRKRRA